MGALLIEGRRNGYDLAQCGRTMTVGELINYLDQFDEDTPVYINNDDHYTFGSITDSSFEDYWPEYAEDEAEVPSYF